MKPLWAYRRRGRIEAVCLTLKSLLIGYDMIPLIGLSKMKRRLEETGEFLRVAVQADPRGNGFALFRGDDLVLAFVACWEEGLAETKEGAAISACGFLADGLPEKECELAKRIWMNWRSPRRARKALEFVERLGYRISRARLVEKKTRVRA